MSSTGLRAGARGGAFFRFCQSHDTHTLMSLRFDAATRQYVVDFLCRSFVLDIPFLFKHKRTAAVAATRGDLGQLAPRKKLLKS